MVTLEMEHSTGRGQEGSFGVLVCFVSGVPVVFSWLHGCVHFVNIHQAAHLEFVHFLDAILQ